MKRSTLAIAISALILVVGSAAIWLLIVAPRLKIPEEVVKPPPIGTGPGTPTEVKDWHGALNLYLMAPEKMPSDARSAELTLVKASVIDDNGAETAFFEGVRRVTLREGMIEKTLSDRIPNGRWSRLRLEFSPNADFSMPDGSNVTAILDRRQAVFSLEADVPVSRSLSLFARLPLDANLKKTGGATSIDILPEPVKAEGYLFGSFMLDERGRGSLWTIPRPTLAEAIKADLGLDISLSQPGSQGFTPADQLPAPKPPL